MDGYSIFILHYKNRKMVLLFSVSVAFGHLIDLFKRVVKTKKQVTIFFVDKTEIEMKIQSVSFLVSKRNESN